MHSVGTEPWGEHDDKHVIVPHVVDTTSVERQNARRQEKKGDAKSLFLIASRSRPCH